MKSLLAATTLCLAMTAPVLADGKIFVQLPDLSSFGGTRAEDFLQQVVLANVVSSNCVGYEISDEDWSLLTDSADLLAYGQLKLDTDTYDREYYKPAFDALDEAGTCRNQGPEVEKVLQDLVDFGGSRQALPDQDQAYTEWRALMDRLQEEANSASAAPAGRTKTK